MENQEKIARIFSMIFSRMTRNDIRKIVWADDVAWRQSMNGNNYGWLDAQKAFDDTVLEVIESMQENDINAIMANIK